MECFLYVVSFLLFVHLCTFFDIDNCGHFLAYLVSTTYTICKQYAQMLYDYLSIEGTCIDL